MSHSEPIISKLAEFIEKRSARDFYLFTMMVIAIGFCLDVFGVAGNWTPRFGALVAGVVAFSYFNDLRQHEAWWRWLENKRLDDIETAEEPIRTAKLEAKLIEARSGSQAARAHRTATFLDTRPAVRDVNSEANSSWLSARRAVRAEGICIAIGTMFWAFGDIPVSFFICGAVTCYS